MVSESEQLTVLIHGIWMNGYDMSLLKRRLEHCGFPCRRFHYPSLTHSPTQNAQRLQTFLQRIETARINFVAHSLGGIVLLRLFELYPEQKPGRLVLLGTPAQGSEVARSLQRQRILRPLLGRSIEQGLLQKTQAWRGKQPLGLIAGSRGPGMGQFLSQLQAPHDGTVRVAEVAVAGAHERIVLPVNHMGLLFSSQVAEKVCLFLQQGTFSRLS
ncbi:MAG: putative lipase [gamma proteobacterium symbiont of Bathyaustriella thionipta]|nr:putative lipase [gamma proteobacterium symbiont of Bathyaustriella thionipta]